MKQSWKKGQKNLITSYKYPGFRWVRKFKSTSWLKYEKPSLLVVITSYLVLVSIYCYIEGNRWKVKRPLIDIVPLLQSPSTDKNAMLVVLLRDTYLRHESRYLESSGTVTIVVEPIIKWVPSRVSIDLKEHIYNFTSAERMSDTMMVSHTISKSLNRHFLASFVSEASAFVHEQLYPLYATSGITANTYSVETPVAISYITFLCHFTVLIVTLVLMVALWGLVNYGTSAKFVLFCCTLFAAKCCLAIIAMGITSSVLSMAVTADNSQRLLIYISEAIGSGILLYIIWHEFKVKHLRIKDSLLMKTFHASPEHSQVIGSSVYSSRDEKSESTVEHTLDPLPNLFGVPLRRTTSEKIYERKRQSAVIRCVTAPIEAVRATSGNKPELSRFSENLD